MVSLYVNLISNSIVNRRTGQAWRLEDVPARWHDDVEAALKQE